MHFATSPRKIALSLLLVPAIAALLLPSPVLACACGCGIFDVGANGGMYMPHDTDTGFSLWLRYSYMDQNTNYEGSSKAPAADNDDKELKTHFFTLGGQYMINRKWSIMAELPAFQRNLTTTDDDGSVTGNTGSIFTGKMFDLGDLMVEGMYTGFFDDLSTGVTFGVKLPTGNYTGPTGPAGGFELDRDSLPGTGSTDLVIGAYHFGTLTSNQALYYFLQGRYQVALATRNAYRPGNELDAAVGLGYGFHLPGFLSRVTPVAQVLFSNRMSDSGAAADPDNSGYTRLIAAPGLELRFDKLRLYADAELPFYQYFNAATPGGSDGSSGQLAASVAYKAQLSYDF